MTIPRNLSFLAEGASSTGVLSVAKGGTGNVTLTAGYIPYGNGTGAFNSSSNLYFSGTQLGIGNTSPNAFIDIYSASQGYAGIAMQGYSSAAKWYLLSGVSGVSIQPFVISTSGVGTSPAICVYPSGGVSIGNTTDAGASNLSVSGIVVGGTDSAIASAHTFVKTAPANKVFTIKNANNASGDQALNILLGTNCNDTSSPLMYGGYGATTSVIIWGNGNIVNANNSYGSSSDIKLKQNISLASSQWDDVKTLGTLVSKYSLISDKTNKLQIGFIAQDVQKICPGLVYETPDRDEKNNLTGTTTLGVNYSIAYMKAFKALSEALERIETLEARLATAKIE